ncbi:MAG: transcription antitermination factor NusB [Eubacteriales bacterium]|nr:transcription antitermination factor NusB [Eubacteriales bacterium]
MSKHAARRAAVQLTYEHLLGGDGGDDTLFGLIEYPQNDEDLSFVHELFNGSKDNQKQFDSVISKLSPKREISRIPALVHAVLLVALYELDYHKDTSDAVVINEALEIIKRFSEPDEAKFANGLLGNYLRQD